MKDTAKSEVALGRLLIAKANDAAGRPERPYILNLRIATCLTASNHPEDSVKQTSTIHVFAHDAAVQAGFARLVGKSVRVRGRVFAHTAHHYAPIVMEVAEIANE
jgi:hypothetical protein